MAIAEFYEVLEINPDTATDMLFGSCLYGRASMEKATWVREKLVDLTGSRPEELPPCFLAVQAEALSPRTGWRTDHGLWQPKELFVSPSVLAYSQELLKPTTPPNPVGMWVKSKLVFRPNDGSKSDLAMTMYNLVTFTTGGALLEEDIALCHVFRVPKDKDKGKGNFSCSFGSAVVPVMPDSVCDKEEDDDSTIYKSFIREVDGWMNYNAYDPYANIGDSPYGNVDYNAYVPYANIGDSPYVGYNPYANARAGSCDLPSIDSLGGSKKRPRSRPAGGSNVWGSFTKIYTKDPEVVYAACHRCCRMMKLTGGSKCGTKSLSSHLASESCKSGSSVDTFSLIRGHGGIVITGSLV